MSFPLLENPVITSIRSDVLKENNSFSQDPPHTYSDATRYMNRANLTMQVTTLDYQNSITYSIKGSSGEVLVCVVWLTGISIVG